MRQFSPTKLACLRCALLALGSLWAGCGYIVGSPYGAEVRTIHVPTFVNESFRRGYELQLTEAVQKQIQVNTPFRLAKEPNADTRLTGRIISLDKRVENQNRYDDARELEMGIAVELTWEDLRSGRRLNQYSVPLPPQIADVVVNTSFAPEAGQSQATATKDAVDQLARKIVSLMEAPW